ncbi:MAG: hypothetical protein SNJ60_04360 [Pseudanabaenaceae cyanobacterium]
MKPRFGWLLLPLAGLTVGCVTGNTPKADQTQDSPLTTAAVQPPAEATASLAEAEAASAERLRRARLEAVFVPTKSLAERQREVRQELATRRQDPFAQLPGTVVVVPPPRPVVPSVPVGAPSPQARPRPVSAPVRSVPVSVRPQPQPLPAASLQVTGVVDMGADIYAIVSVPGDLTSQYVRRGQRLASGIYVQDVFAGPSPGVVVLQNGRRFVRYVN